MTAARIDCSWCGKPNRIPSDWEQRNLRGQWQRLCRGCCNKRRGISALLDVRRVETEQPA